MLSSLILVRIYQSQKFPIISRSVVIGSITGMVFATTIYMGLYIGLVKPEKVLFGYESKADFLRRNVRDYSGIEFINDNLKVNEKTLLLWDGRGYYCKTRCISDIDQSLWVASVEKFPDIESISQWLQTKKITHLFLSNEDASFFILKHDENGIQRKSLDFLIQDYAPKCGEIIHEDGWTQVIELKTNKSDCK